MAEPSYAYRAKFVRSVDGDTVILKVDLGFRLTIDLDIRLAGIDTPERGQPGWATATEFTRQWLNGHPDITVSTQRDPEKYGRWLGVIVAAGVQRSLNDELLVAGLAKPYSGGSRLSGA